MADLTYLGEEEFRSLLAREGFAPTAFDTAQRWVDRGDTALLYRNEDLSSRDVGNIQIVSYGGPAAQLEAENFTEIPTTLPDIGGNINWRYQLFAAYRGQTSEGEDVTAFLDQQEMSDER